MTPGGAPAAGNPFTLWARLRRRSAFGKAALAAAIVPWAFLLAVVLLKPG